MTRRPRASQETRPSHSCRSQRPGRATRTAVVGMFGGSVGGCLYWALNSQPDVAFSLAGNGWRGGIVSICGALLMISMLTVLRGTGRWSFLSSRRRMLKQRARSAAALRSTLQR